MLNADYQGVLVNSYWASFYKKVKELIRNLKSMSTLYDIK
ncbi:hypothetical protein BTH160X_50250 [Brochothrix thermosphacta]|nr:hypothetical protein BTH160X_50250 [Brochothrix thermosphacta]